MPIIGARVSEQLLDQYPRPIIDTKNTVDDIESAHESEGNDGHGGNTFFTSGCLSFEQGCIFCLTCSHPELTEDHVLTSAYVKIFRTVTRNAIIKSF